MTPFDHLRIAQLVSPYSPDEAPSLPLDFGDYLSVVWRLDQAGRRGRAVPYYRRCERALSGALRLTETELDNAVRHTAAGRIGAELSNVAYRGNERRVDATDRKAAVAQLWTLRSDLLTMGTYAESWQPGWPGGGIEDEELRDRVFAILFTALPSQFPPYARLLPLADIVLQELLIGTRRGESHLLHHLVRDHGWPPPLSVETRALFTARD